MGAFEHLLHSLEPFDGKENAGAASEPHLPSLVGSSECLASSFVTCLHFATRKGPLKHVLYWPKKLGFTCE
jgi:hypothetical protein